MRVPGGESTRRNSRCRPCALKRVRRSVNSQSNEFIPPQINTDAPGWKESHVKVLSDLNLWVRRRYSTAAKFTMFPRWLRRRKAGGYEPPPSGGMTQVPSIMLALTG